MPSMKRPRNSGISGSTSTQNRSNRSIVRESEDLFASDNDFDEPLQPSRKKPSPLLKKSVYKDDTKFSKIISEAGLVLKLDNKPNTFSEFNNNYAFGITYLN